MTKAELNKLLSKGEFPEKTEMRKLIETHAAWVILCDNFVYKIKKPMQFSFLDFSTFELRKYFCEREVELNRRLTPDVYIGVVPITRHNDTINMGGDKGETIDHAVKMHKLPADKQMDILLTENKVSKTDIKNLAKIIADFHKETAVIKEKNLADIREEYNDLQSQKEYLTEHSGQKYGDIIDRAIATSNAFLDQQSDLLATRLRDGFYRDCHGDLHSRNIFLLPEPVPFDCIEFNDDFRHIDVLNEIAFFCMDMDAFGREDLSELFLEKYNELFPTITTPEERQLFIYYKSYRANIRAKVNSLRARSVSNSEEKSTALRTAEKYLLLVKKYLKDL